MLEIVAGCIEPGERPRPCVAREIREETGHTVRALRRLGTVYPSPGYCDEAIHLFYAVVSPVALAPSPDEDEHIRVVCMTRREVEDAIRRGTIQDGKTVAAWLLFKLRRGGPSSVRSSPARR